MMDSELILIELRRSRTTRISWQQQKIWLASPPKPSIAVYIVLATTLPTVQQRLLKMKYIFSQEQLVVPDDVKIHIRSRIVTVEGPRGKSEQHTLIERGSWGTMADCLALIQEN
jgi:hypothetical protein